MNYKPLHKKHQTILQIRMINRYENQKKSKTFNKINEPTNDDIIIVRSVNVGHFRSTSQSSHALSVPQRAANGSAFDMLYNTRE